MRTPAFKATMGEAPPRRPLTSRKFTTSSQTLAARADGAGDARKYPRRRAPPRALDIDGGSITIGRRLSGQRPRCGPGLGRVWAGASTRAARLSRTDAHMTKEH